MKRPPEWGHPLQLFAYRIVEYYIKAFFTPLIQWLTNFPKSYDSFLLLLLWNPTPGCMGSMS